MQIKSLSGKVLFKSDHLSLRLTLEAAIKSGAYLGGADLRGANLSEADLSEADLRGAYLGGAYLQKIKTPAVNDHYFVSEILFRAAKTESQKNFAARIRIELKLCWNDFYELAKKMKVVAWATKTLCQWKEFEDKIKEIKEG